MSKNPLNQNTILELIFDCLRSNGYSPDEIIRARELMLGKYGLGPDEYADNISPVLWQEIYRLTCDENIGLHLAEKVAVTGQTIITYMTMSSETIGAGIEKAVRYQTTLSYATKVSLKRFGHGCRLYFSLAKENESIRHQSEFFVLALLKWFAMMLNRSCPAKVIHFHHARPDDDGEQRRLLGENIHYDCKAQYVEFDVDFWAISSPFVNAQLAKTHEQQARDQQQLKQQYLLLLEVKAHIIENLSLQQCTVTAIAQAVHLPERQLQSQLAEIGVSYTELLEDTRQELAAKLLSRSELNISEIAFRCGYAEPSVFNRAFKRWYDVTPRQYRQNLTMDIST